MMIEKFEYYRGCHKLLHTLYFLVPSLVFLRTFLRRTSEEMVGGILNSNYKFESPNFEIASSDLGLYMDFIQFHICKKNRDKNVSHIFV